MSNIQGSINSILSSLVSLNKPSDIAEQGDQNVRKEEKKPELPYSEAAMQQAQYNAYQNLAKLNFSRVQAQRQVAKSGKKTMEDKFMIDRDDTADYTGVTDEGGYYL